MHKLMYIIVAELREEMTRVGNPHLSSPKRRGEEDSKIFGNLVVVIGTVSDGGDGVFLASRLKETRK